MINEGDVVLALIPQADDVPKTRPAVLLRKMPPFDDFLLCGISTQLHQRVEGLDEIISIADSDFAQSGLRSSSLIRLGFLVVLPSRKIAGSIGALDPTRHTRLIDNLIRHLAKSRPSSILTKPTLRET